METLSTYALIFATVLSASFAETIPTIPLTAGETASSESRMIASQQSKWSGTLILHEKMTWPEGKSSSERHVEVSFTEALPTLHRSDPTTDLNFTDDKGTGTVRFRAESNLAGRGTTDCSGIGQAELHEVVVDQTDKTYRIEASGPPCVGTSVLIVPNNPTEITPYGPETTSIIVNREYSSDPKFNPNVLSGTETKVADIGGTDAKVTTTITWFLTRGPIEAELIVTPADYDTWLPEPGRDELTKGSKPMDISLKVQGRNGRPATLEAVAFELRLSNTSKEPGITLNAPLNPSANQLPDLRFLHNRIGESIEEDQFIRINSNDGSTGEVTIASYDGGGWTTLTAEAILKGGMRIKGSLLRPGGVKEIPIPKRDPGEHIAASWLAANGNPPERDDRDRSRGNTNLGDGLTAYEEYRGFIGFKEDAGVFSGPEFIRLNPQKKELGVRMTSADLSLFAEGILWFKNASEIKPIVFSENEIGTDRRLNKNVSNAHIYDQYVIKLENADLPGDVVGQNDPNNVKPMYPERSQRVAIDKAQIDQSYQRQSSGLPANMRMPYTAEEELANTVAHELAHSVNVVHHGESSPVPPRKAYANSQPPYRIYWFDGTEETDRPYPVDPNVFLERVGTVGNDSSGDLACIMAYTNLYNWAFMTAADRALLYRKTRLLPVGKMFCTKITGTGMNKCVPNGTGFRECPMYFGDATYGNCLSQFKLKP